LKARRRGVDFDRVLIDWADELIQDLVVSFSARRPTTTLRLVVCGLYVFAALHLLFAAILPFYGSTMAGVIGAGAPDVRRPQIEALATGIIVGGISYHLAADGRVRAAVVCGARVTPMDAAGGHRHPRREFRRGAERAAGAGHRRHLSGASVGDADARRRDHRAALDGVAQRIGVVLSLATSQPFGRRAGLGRRFPA
jgi:hypothetical protein